ncbi:hypothetical protein CPAR01_04738 [Colletotrichum paranaense]|uniref:Uncharacterized protein n=1 Tax=Colletotrichum paranaense TaxID=1914294 RepID=A0ABQ9SX72_9PEZI|nr:uncharacterized protein CPAR01_04738 [Colletotrichum paranaense]KAK1544105.1 hypothetical protein CPAR01_04738 [Colletotrichum paranaense]
MSLQKPTGFLPRSTWNCSAEITANPDVSGIGVIVGFVGTGGLIILLLTVHYLFAYDPTLDPFRTLKQTNAKTSRPNSIDVAFLGWFRGHMTHFGFQWFSAVTHLGALTYLRNYYINRANQCIWRLALMTVVLVMLIAVMIIGVPIRADLEQGHAPAICVLSHRREKYVDNLPEVALSTSISVLMMALGFAFRVLKMGRCTSDRFQIFRDKYRTKVINIVKLDRKPPQICTGPWVHMTFVAKPLSACWLCGRTYLEFFNSIFGELFWLTFMASWGLTHLIYFRTIAGREAIWAIEPIQDGDATSIQDAWGFGQVTAVILFASPIIFIVEAFCSIGSQEPSSLHQDAATSFLQSSPGGSRRVTTGLPEDTMTRSGSLETEQVKELARSLQPKSHMELASTRISSLTIIIFNIVFVAHLLVFFFYSPKTGGVVMASSRLGAWYLLYQPLLVHLIYLMGFELEPRIKRSELRRWIHVACFIILIFFSYLVTSGIWSVGSWLNTLTPFDYVSSSILLAFFFGYVLYVGLSFANSRCAVASSQGV